MSPTEFPSVTLKDEKSSVTAVLHKKFQENKGKTTALSSTSMALILSACGSSDDTSTSTLLSLTKSGDNYSASSVTGFALNNQTVATFDVADASSNAYSIKLDATGAGTLHFDFADAGDEVTLQAGSKVAGFTTLKVTDGSIDATNADLSSITRVEVASGIKITLAQIKTIPTIVSNSATGKIEVEVASEAEATELVSLMTAGTVSVFAATNPIDLVAAPAAPATLTAEVLTAKETETTATVKTVAEAPADTTATTPTTPTDDTTTTTPTDDTTTTTPTTPTVDTTADVAPTIGGGSATLPVTHLGSGLYKLGGDNGNVAITKVGDNAVFSADVGGGTSIARGNITTLSSDGITVTSTAEAIDGKTTAGTSAFTVTGSDGAQTVTIGSTGTGTIAMGAGADTVNVTATGGAHTVTVTSEASTTNTVNFTGAGTTNAIAMSGTAATTLDTSGSTQAYALTGATNSLVVQNANASINAAAYSGSVTYEVTNTAASALATGTGATTIKVKGTDGTQVVTVDADAAGGTAGAITIADGGAVAGDLTVTNIESAVSIADSFTGTGDIILSTDDASVTLALGTSTTGTRTIDASTAAADKTVTITGSDAVAITSATADLDLEAYAGAVSAQITNTDNMSIKAGTGATGLMLKGNTSGKTVTIDADAGTGTGGAISLANGGSVQGLVAITGLEGGLSIADDYAGTGAIGVVLASNAQTLALGTSTTATPSVNGDALSDAEAVTMTGSDAVSVSLVAGDLTAGAYLGAMTVTATTGTNVITTGDGDDTIIGGAGADTIDGDAGTDTASYADITAAATAQHGIANADLKGIAVNLSASAVGGAAINTAMAGTVYLGGGADATSHGADLAVGGVGYIVGGGDDTGGGVRDTLANVEAVIGSARADYMLGSGNDDTFIGGAGADVMDAAAGTGDVLSYADIVTGSDQHGITDAALLGVIINVSGSGVSQATLTAAMQAAGTDTYHTPSDAATADGKAGYIAAANNTTGADVLDTISNFESFIGSSRADYIALGSGGGLTANGGAGIDVIVNNGTGVDTLIGGAGNDVFEYATSAAFIGATSGADAVIDSITGGDGTADVIKIAGAIGIGAAGADTLARVASVEKLAAAANADGSNNYAHAITIASDAAMGSVRTIDLSADADADATTAITLTGVTVATTIKSAAAGASTIIGTSAADIITGGAKIDAITGGGGADTIDLGSDSVIDNVIYTGASDFGDTISNFAIGTGAGKDDISLATALGDSSGALTFRTAVAFNTDEATTLTALTSDAGSDGNYIVELTGSTIDATLLEAIDAALAAGSAATGKTFVLIDNGTNSALLYDADSSDASVDLALVCTLDGVANITGGTDVVIL